MSQPMPPSTEDPQGRFGPAEEPADAVPAVRELLIRLRAAAEVARTPQGAAELLEAVAREMVGELGRYDRDTLATWREAARRQGEAGDPAAAIHLLEQVILDMAQALGAGDPETLTARLDLAAEVGRAGDAGGALRRLHDLLPALTAAVGADDARVLRARAQYAAHTAAVGDLGGSVHQLVQLVPQVQQALGEEHPLLGEARTALARAAQQLGRAPGAPPGLGWIEAVAIVHRLTVWDFDTDREALDCLSELERRTGLKGLADRIYGAPDHLTAEQVTTLALGRPTGPA
ncbi:hypothetical protein AB0D08_03290 [Kitasatospora sp. NPDC048540]|uniref:hypothetical protein n=1 Tax=unclassified Kitasatospora TaxID=2633591 RepID=UPI00053AFC89|nr:hypothetical protein [Kitasatospora sp. MBT63]